jgi:hypothetical protein
VIHPTGIRQCDRWAARVLHTRPLLQQPWQACCFKRPNSYTMGIVECPKGADGLLSLNDHLLPVPGRWCEPKSAAYTRAKFTCAALGPIRQGLKLLALKHKLLCCHTDPLSPLLRVHSSKHKITIAAQCTSSLFSVASASALPGTAVHCSSSSNSSTTSSKPLSPVADRCCHHRILSANSNHASVSTSDQGPS